MDATTKTGKDFVKTASKRVVSAESTGDLIGNKITDNITSVGKPNNKKEKDEINVMEDTEEIFIPLQKRKQIIDDLKLF